MAYETSADQLYELVNKSGMLGLRRAALELHLSLEHAEKLANILEKSGLIGIHYPLIGEIKLVKRPVGKPAGGVRDNVR